MTFNRLALSNVRGSWQRYVAYFLACVASVATFYTFISFVTSEAVLRGRIVGSMRPGLNQGLIGVAVVVVIFSFLFILYSTAAFIRARKKEFGLLTLLGLTQRQLRRMVFIELGLIAGTALAVGLIGGIVFSRLFFMAMAALLEATSPIPFNVPLNAVVGTAVVFTLMFCAANAVSLFGVRASSITELLKAARQPRLAPQKRPLLLLLGLALTGLGYYLAWITGGESFIQRALLIIGVTVAGTYFLATQGAIYICDWLKRRTALYRRGTNLLVVNRLVFRLTDNARAIFLSAVLIAIVGSSLGAINSLLQNARTMAIGQNPYAITARLSPTADPALVGERVRQLLLERGVTTIEAQFVSPVRAEWTMSTTDSTTKRQVLVTDNAAYNSFARLNPAADPVTIPAGEAMLVWPSEEDAIRGSAALHIGGSPVTVNVTSRAHGGWFSGQIVFVLNDADFARLPLQITRDQQPFVGFEYRGWERQRNLADDLRATLGEDLYGLGVRAEDYHTLRSSAMLTLFIGLVLASLFYVAAGSLLYFKLFTEIGEDRAHYTILQDIGVTRGEVNRLVANELAGVFFVPVAIGALHTGFALKTLSNLLAVDMNLIGPGAMICLVYLAAQTAYFWVSTATYKRTVLTQA